MRVGVVHVTPSVEAVNTMSFAVQLVRKRQSCQTTYTVPPPSTAAEGSGDVRRFPATVWSEIVEMVVEGPQLAPPVVEVNVSILSPLHDSKGTITVPLGCTTGWPPIPLMKSADVSSGPQVRPPSVEVLIQIRPLAEGLSH